ncbi:hypothetical protein PGTDC60_1711 [Porphyromonas gingivalis TDC60]|nr:hypothetical protein PGTDC60_1711 [Porphyromonas gingivalis TDC60]
MLSYETIVSSRMSSFFVSQGKINEQVYGCQVNRDFPKFPSGIYLRFAKTA